MDDGSDQVDELILEPARTGRPSQPRGLWAVLAVVAVTVSAVAVSSAGDDDPPRPGLRTESGPLAFFGACCSAAARTSASCSFFASWPATWIPSWAPAPAWD